MTTTTSERPVLDRLGATFLRRPRGAEVIADAVRLATLVSVPVAAVGWGWIAFAVLLLALLGVVVPRVLGLRPAVDVAVCVLALVAAWSSVLGWYTSVFLWDKVVHFALLAALTAVLWVIASDTGVLRTGDRVGRVQAVVVSGVLSLAIGSVWEIFEFLGHTYLDPSIVVGYEDTIGDLAADLGGGVLAGLLLPWAVRDRRVVTSDGRPGTRVRSGWMH